MADKSFGVKELNLLNASGTPTVTSPNNLNLNANTVAISTSCTIGNNLTVTSTTNSANLNITGIGTLTRAFATDLSVSGVSTITVPANANPHSSWDVVNNSASAYRFTGPGQDGAEDNPDIYLVRGQRYVFKMNASGHPFQIRVSNGGSAYSDGVTNNGAQTGNVVFNVQHDAPAHLFYQCTSHGSMVGNIYIVGQHLANGANNRVLTATSAYGINAESNMTFDGDDLTISHTGLAVNIFESTDNHSRLRIRSSDASLAQLEFADQTDADAGEIRYDHANDRMTIHVGNNVERLRIDSSGNVTKPDNFHILVDRDGNQTGYNASNISDVIIWNRVRTSESSTGASSNFNTSTGLFTAPVTGMYLFHASVNCNYNNEGAWLVINGSRPNFANFYPNGTTSADGMITYHLTSGDTVGIKWYDNGNTNATINNNANHTWWRIILLG